jgi:hypothetical protein
MEIVFLKGEGKNPFTQAIIFSALVDEKNIECSVSREVLEDCYNADWESTALNVFINNRSNFENIAEGLILNGRFEQDGSITIRVSDLRL